MNDAELAELRAALTDKNDELARVANELRKIQDKYIAEMERRQLPGTVHHLPQRPAPGGTGDERD